jgi:hypothetical protein
MSWECIHLYEFHLRAEPYGLWELSAPSPDITLAALRLCKGARFIYRKVNDRLAAELTQS